MFLRLFSFLIISFSILANHALALTPEEARVITPLYIPKFKKFSPPLGTYRYKVSWQGISAAYANISLKEEGDHYLLETSAKTNSAVSFFYKLKYKAGSKITKDSYTPINSYYDLVENSREQHAELVFKDHGKIKSFYQKYDREPKKLNFDTHNNTLDPFSAAFIARSLNWEVGQTRVFDTYNGKSRYIISLTAKGKSVLKVAGVKRGVWLISPVVRKVGSNKQAKLRDAVIYVSDDEKREILQIDSEVFVGTIKTKLIGFKPQKKLNKISNFAKAESIKDKKKNS